MKDYFKRNSFTVSIIAIFSLCMLALGLTSKQPAYYPFEYVNYQDLADKYNYRFIDLDYEDYSIARFINDDYTVDLSYGDTPIEVCISRNTVVTHGFEAHTDREPIEAFSFSDNNLAPLVSALKRNASH